METFLQNPVFILNHFLISIVSLVILFTRVFH